MKILTILLSSFICISVSIGQKKSDEVQKNLIAEKVINSQWTFNYFPIESADKGYESAGYDDSKWQAISLPHTWSTFETTGELHPFIRSTSEGDNPYWWTGWGWYRKHFSINSNYSGKKVFIQFEGVQKYCKVWINGKYMGDHKGGYGSFDFDITQNIIPGKDNVIAVAVNNRQNDQFKIPPMTAGNLNVYGGIYRDVIIVLKNNLYIPMQGSASHEGGTFISTPGLSENEGIVRIRTWVKNDGPQMKNCVLQTTIFDASKKRAQVIKTTAEINPGQLYMFDQTSKPVNRPHLWSNDAPYLYEVYSEVIDGKDIVDTYSSPLGFRWFSLDNKENELYLNGKKVTLRGGTHYQEYPWLGDAIPKWIAETDYTGIAKNLNYNFICTAEFPNDKIVYNLADKLGIVIYEESPSIRNQDFSAEVQEQQMKEMIRRDRNHPSIFFWGLGRETNRAVNSKYAWAEDTSRIITAFRVTEGSAGQYVRNNPVEDLLHCNVPQQSHDTVTAQVDTRVEPSRIILTASQKNFLSDRGSVAIITADIVDIKGNHVNGAKNTLKWKITGPATFVGPTGYVSALNKESDGAWYIETPVSNVIRSTGLPGKIHITAASSGLASGSFDIEAKEIISDNSIISEPVLNNKGRQKPGKIVITVKRLDEIPPEIKQTSEELKFGVLTGTGYVKAIREYIVKNNPSVDTATIEFSSLIDIFSKHLINNNGDLIADDYNFSVDHFNNCRLIAGYINSTKLPALFKDELKEYYSNSVILQGNEKNAGDEMNWLNWIPSGGTVVFCSEIGKSNSVKGALLSNSHDLIDLIVMVYPGFVKFSPEAKQRAFEFITKMNPYVHVVTGKDQGNSGNKDRIQGNSYKAENGKLILIPLLKFISE